MVVFRKLYWNRLLLLLAGAILLLGACRKDDEGPTRYINITQYWKNSAHFSFVGYKPDELDSVIIHVYAHGTNYSKLLWTDSVCNPLQFPRDTVLTNDLNWNGFPGLKDSFDYVITLPSANRSHFVSDISYPPLVVYDTSTKPFSTGGHPQPNPMAPDSATVDGTPVASHYLYLTYSSTFYLVKP